MKRTRGTQDEVYWITSLPENMIQRIVDFLGYYDAWSLNQTCKILHQCVPSSIQEISYCNHDIERLKNRELILSEALVVNDMPEVSGLFNLIQLFCPKLKYLFIKYNCKDANPTLCLNRVQVVETFMKINMLNKNCELWITPPSAVEKFTAHISRIDAETSKDISRIDSEIFKNIPRVNPETLEIIPDKYYEGTIYLEIETFKKIRSW
jgi:hypothetical protein